MIGSIVGIIGSVMGIVATMVGDAYIAKWVSAFRVWWRQHAWQSLKEETDRQYEKLSAEFADLCGDRPDCKGVSDVPGE